MRVCARACRCRADRAQTAASSSSSQTELTAASGSTLRSFSPGFDMLRLGGRMCALSALVSVLLAGVVASSSSSDLFDNQLGDINYCKKQCQLVIKNKSPAKVSDVIAAALPPSAGCFPISHHPVIYSPGSADRVTTHGVSEKDRPCLGARRPKNGCSSPSSAFDGVNRIHPAHVRDVNCAKCGAFSGAFVRAAWGQTRLLCRFSPLLTVPAASIWAERAHWRVQDGCDSHMVFCIWETRIDCQCRMPPFSSSSSSSPRPFQVWRGVLSGKAYMTYELLRFSTNSCLVFL